MNKIRSNRILSIVLWTAALTCPAWADGLEPYFPSMRKTPLVYVDDTVLTAYDFGTYLAGSGNTPTAWRERDLDSLSKSLQWFIDDAVIVPPGIRRMSLRSSNTTC